MFRASLFWKTFGSFLILVVLTSLVGGFVADWNVRNEVERESQVTLRNQLELIYELFADALPTERNDELQSRVRDVGERTRTRITLIAPDGEVVADSSKDPYGMDNHADRPEVVESRTATFGSATRYSDTLGMHMVYMARAAPSEDGFRGYVRGAIPLVHLEDRLSSLRRTVLGATALAVLLGLIGALISARMLSGPLQSMRETATAIAAGDLERRVQIHTADEVGDLGHAFNEMATNLQREIDTARREQREMSAILGGMVEGVLAVDTDERIALVNDAACVILGLDAEDVRGRPLWKALRLPQVPDTLRRAVREGQVQSSVISLRADGRERTVRLHVSPLSSHAGEARGAVLVLDDVTERRRLEEIRRDFVANASHELKTPVASIRGMAETVLGDPAMDEEVRRGFLSRMLSQSHRLGDLIDEMLALSRLESETEGMTGQSVDLREPVRTALEDFAMRAREKRVKIGSQIAEDPLRIDGQVEAFRRIAGNLLDNAIKYTPRGGEVHVRLGRDDDHILLEVEDTGAGIPPDKQDRVFERFYRVDESRARSSGNDGGTGLGLAIVKHLVQMLKGNVEIESRPGRGSTFRVRFPCA